jgi:hypothetical protein
MCTETGLDLDWTDPIIVCAKQVYVICSVKLYSNGLVSCLYKLCTVHKKKSLSYKNLGFKRDEVLSN